MAVYPLASHRKTQWVVSCAVAALFFAIGLSAQTPAFIGKNFIVNGGNGTPAVGDFNGDGKLDLALANTGAAVLLGNGDGTFQPALQYTAGTQPLSIATGDFNGDGKLDLALSDAASGAIFILLGNGDGTFQSANQFPTTPGAQTVSIVVADFNGDGKLDVAVADQSGCGGSCSTIEVLLGNGDGTLQPARTTTVGASPNALAVGDFNRDGVPDLAVTWGQGNLSILLGNGDGTLQAPITIALGSTAVATGLAVGDFNGDGNQDLAVAGGAANSVSVLLGNGNGTFSSPVSIADSLSQVPAAVAVADFNGDGKQDLVVALSKCCGNSGEGAFGVMLGDGSGAFQPMVRYLVPGFTISNSANFLAVADFNGDGKPDVALLILSGVPGVTVMTNSTGVSAAPLAIASLTLAPASVTGGVSASATITLAPGAVAPAGSLTIPLDNPNPDSLVASIPANVQMISDMANVNVGIPTNSGVTASSTTLISATINGVTKSATLTVNPPFTPPALAAVSLNSTGLTGGAATAGTVTLNEPAPFGDANVNLSVSNPAMATVTGGIVPAGMISGTFTVMTNAVNAPGSADITASYGGVTRSATITLNPPLTITSLTLTPTTVAGGDTCQGTVTLSGPAPGGGVTVKLAGSSTAAIPGNGTSLDIPAGQTIATFAITTSKVTSTQTVTISASLGGATQTATLTVMAPIIAVSLASLTISPASVNGGGSAVATVALTAASSASTSVTLASSDKSAASVPATVTIPAGATSATFMVSTSAVYYTTTVMITATAGGVSKTAPLSVTGSYSY